MPTVKAGAGVRSATSQRGVLAEPTRFGVQSGNAPTGTRSASPQGRASTPTLGAPVIFSFTSSTSAPAAGSFPEPGDDATLAWSVMNATGISIDQGVGAVTGTSLVVTPSATTTYTLTATNSITGEVATAQALAKVRILVDVSGTLSTQIVGRIIDTAGETIDPSATQEFVLRLQSGAVIQGLYPFASFQHYGKFLAEFEFHPDTIVYIRAHPDAAAGTTPIIGAPGSPGGYGAHLGGTKASWGCGGGGGSSGYAGTPSAGGAGGDVCLVAERNGDFKAQAGTNTAGGAGADGGASSTAFDDCDGGAGLDGALAVYVSSGDASIPGNLWLDIGTAVSGGVKIIGGAGSGGGGTMQGSQPGAGGTGGGPGLNGLPGNKGPGSGGIGLGHAGGDAAAALQVVTSTGAGSYLIVNNDFGPSFLGNNTSNAGAVTEV